MSPPPLTPTHIMPAFHKMQNKQRYRMQTPQNLVVCPFLGLFIAEIGYFLVNNYSNQPTNQPTLAAWIQQSQQRKSQRSGLLILVSGRYIYFTLLYFDGPLRRAQLTETCIPIAPD